MSRLEEFVKSDKISRDTNSTQHYYEMYVNESDQSASPHHFILWHLKQIGYESGPSLRLSW